MSFATGYLADPVKVGAGERFDPKSDTVLTARTFEDGLVVGRFAKLDTGSLDNIDSSSTPVVAGVVLRKASNPIEDASTIDSDLFSQVEYLRAGLVTVDVVAADTPAQFGSVFVKNTNDADAGKATTVDDATTEAANAEFIEEVKANVWLVRLK